MGLKYTAIRAAFDALWLASAPKLFDRFSQARGLIWTLHRVVPETPAPFSPNGILQVQPAFLAYCLERLVDRKTDIVSLDEALERLGKPKTKSPFVVLTFDDGYRDNLHHALPLLEQAQAPFTLYVPTAYPSGQGHLWWQAIEDIIAAQTEIRFYGADGALDLPAVTIAQKQAAFNHLYWHMRLMPEPDRLRLLASFTQGYGYDLAAQCSSLIMDWAEIGTMAANPLCTIGAHTVHHYELAKLPQQQMRWEMEWSAQIIEEKLGRRPRHFSYPLGGPLSCGPREFEMARELGFASAVTTSPGGLYPHHLKRPTALPRVSLNGLFQEKRYLDIFASAGLFTQLGKLTD